MAKFLTYLRFGDLKTMQGSKLALGTEDPDAVQYSRFHEKRYRFLIQTLSPLLVPGTRVLDIGLSGLPRILRRQHPGIRISTLGYVDERFWKPGEWPHFECNLNDPAFPWASIGQYHLIIFAEVLEHLYTPPQRILKSLRSVLEPGGHLVIQTPNAASLEKRIKLLCGFNPYEIIREDPRNPGHYREYTVSELAHLARACGFSVSRLSVKNYFSPNRMRARAYNGICSMLPQTVRDGITMALEAD